MLCFRRLAELAYAALLGFCVVQAIRSGEHVCASLTALCAAGVLTFSGVFRE